jgi:hypothetical protein
VPVCLSGMMWGYARVATALAAACGFAATAWAQDVPLLYGGDSANAEAAQQALVDASEAKVDSDQDPRWFLEPIDLTLPGVVVLGEADLVSCESDRVSTDVVRTQTAAGVEQLEFILPAEASVLLEQAAVLLPCLDGPPEPVELAKLHFARGISALTRPGRDVPLGHSAFEAAISAQQELPWNEDYPAFPRSVFFEAKVNLLTTPRARVWVLPSPGLRVFIDGHALEAEESGSEVLAGRHLLHIRSGEDLWSGTVTVKPDARVVVGGPPDLWRVITADAVTEDAASRAFTTRQALAASWDGNVVVTRPGASAVLDGEGVLATWSDEGRYRPRPRIELLVGWLPQALDIKTPPVDYANPSLHWGAPRVGAGLQITRWVSVRVAGGAAWSGPFDVDGTRRTRWMGLATAGVGAERPDGPVRLGVRADLIVLFPGSMSIQGEQSLVILGGPVASGTVSLRLTERVWIVAEAGVGWVGTATGSVSVGPQFRLPPL